MILPACRCRRHQRCQKKTSLSRSSRWIPKDIQNLTSSAGYNTRARGDHLLIIFHWRERGQLQRICAGVTATRLGVWYHAEQDTCWSRRQNSTYKEYGGWVSWVHPESLGLPSMAAVPRVLPRSKMRNQAFVSRLSRFLTLPCDRYEHDRRFLQRQGRCDGTLSTTRISIGHGCPLPNTPVVSISKL